MRLYRGKALSDGRWVYGYYRYYKDRDVHKIDRGDQLEAGCDVDGDTVGQSTGLKDKNGVEIYKFDIFNIDGKNYYIDWSDDMCRFVLTTGYGFDSRNCIDLTCDSVYGLDIKGNKYDNPELINVD